MKRTSSSGTPAKVEALLRRALPPRAGEKLALPDIRKEWTSLVGSAVASKSYPDNLDEGVLFVKASSPAAAKVISMKGASLAREITKRTGISVSGVRVMIGRVSSPRISDRHGKEPSRIVPPRQEVERNLEEIRESFSPEKEAVAKRLASLMALFQRRFPGR